jgi:hypothetical protein
MKNNHCDCTKNNVHIPTQNVHGNVLHKHNNNELFINTVNRTLIFDGTLTTDEWLMETSYSTWITWTSLVAAHSKYEMNAS